MCLNSFVYVKCFCWYPHVYGSKVWEKIFCGYDEKSTCVFLSFLRPCRFVLNPFLISLFIFSPLHSSLLRFVCLSLNVAKMILKSANSGPTNDTSTSQRKVVHCSDLTSRDNGEVLPNSRFLYAGSIKRSKCLRYDMSSFWRIH